MSINDLQNHFEYLNNQVKAVNEIIDEKISDITPTNNYDLLRIEKFYFII